MAPRPRTRWSTTWPPINSTATPLPLELHFQAVVAWVRAVFHTYRREMKGQPWGNFYDRYRTEAPDTAALEAHVAELMLDEEVENKRGIYEYVLDGRERHLTLRAFSDKQKREACERQGGVCVKCGKYFEFEEMAGDHIVPSNKGGKTRADNSQMLCAFDNGSKGAN